VKRIALCVVMGCLLRCIQAQEIGNISAPGSGCKPGSISTSRAPDGKAASVLFTNLKAATEGGRRTAKNSCEVELAIHLPAGQSLVATTGAIRAAVDLQRPGHAGIRVEAKGLGKPALSERKLNAAIKATVTIPIVWRADAPGQCGGDVRLRARFDVAVQSKAAALVRIDSLDIGGSEAFRTEPCATQQQPSTKPTGETRRNSERPPDPQTKDRQQEDTGRVDYRRMEPPRANAQTTDTLTADGNTIHSAQATIEEAVARVRAIRDQAQKTLDAAVPEPVKQEVFWYITLIEPKVVSDAFGKRIAERFVAAQVTIANKNQSRQYLIHDVSFDFSGALSEADRKNCPHPTFPTVNLCEFSSHELSLLRGVAEKGEAWDARNVLLRALQGAGTVGAGLIGIPIRGPSYAASVAIFNGPLISSFRNIFPDFTTNQMNRLSDSAYIANSLVPKGQSKVIVAFLPQSVFLSKEDREAFWKEPHAVLNRSGFLRRLVIRIDGEHIVETTSLAPADLNMVIDWAQLVNLAGDKPELRGHINGRFLKGGTVTVVSPDYITLSADGVTSDSRIDFILRSSKPVLPGTELQFKVGKENKEEGAGSKILKYEPPAPRLSGVDPASMAPGEEKVLTLTGENLFTGATELIVPAGSGLTVGAVDKALSNSQKLVIKVKATAAAAKAKHKLRVKTPGGESGEIDFEIK